VLDYFVSYLLYKKQVNSITGIDKQTYHLAIHPPALPPTESTNTPASAGSEKWSTTIGLN
jgi:hypothetical protein